MFLKKIIIFSTTLFFLGVSNVFAAYDVNNLDGVTNNNESQGVKTDTTNAGNLPGDKNGIIGKENKSSSTTSFNCTPGKDSLCSEKFTINTSLFSPGGKSFVAKGGAQKTMTAFFTTLIQKLMVALGSLALLIMVIGAGFMIFAMGKDDSLNKGKTIFKSGVIALAIALSSYFMVSFLSYILYAVG